MHSQSMDIMRKFSHRYVSPGDMVLDVGSMDINGSYRRLFDDYTGIDTRCGDNVDICVDNPYTWPIPSECYNVIISGQTFEHVEYPWELMKEIHRVLTEDGVICIIAPAEFPIHRHPIDCWRFLEDGMRALAKYTMFEVIECYTTKRDDISVVKRKSCGKKKKRPSLGDTVLIAKKVA